MKFTAILSSFVIIIMIFYCTTSCGGAYFDVRCYFNSDCSCTQGDRPCCMFKRENERNSTVGSCFCCPGTLLRCPANTSTNESCGCYKWLMVANLSQTSPITCKNGGRNSTHALMEEGREGGHGIQFEEQIPFFMGQGGIYISLDEDSDDEVE